jgi:DNA-binding NtrC family response regulator
MAQLSVLVIDDDTDVRDGLKAQLSEEGHRVVCCSQPSQALELLRQDEAGFHIVILDLLLPQISGLDLLPSIRDIDDDVAVIILTSYPSVESASASIHHDISAYISKPYDRLKLSETIERIARKKGLVFHSEEALHQTIGRNIRELRKKKSLTLKQIARRTNLSVSLLSQLERGESAASVSSLYKVAVALDVKLTDLFGDF